MVVHGTPLIEDHPAAALQSQVKSEDTAICAIIDSIIIIISIDPNQGKLSYAY